MALHVASQYHHCLKFRTVGRSIYLRNNERAFHQFECYFQVRGQNLGGKIQWLAMHTFDIYVMHALHKLTDCSWHCCWRIQGSGLLLQWQVQLLAICGMANTILHCSFIACMQLYFLHACLHTPQITTEWLHLKCTCNDSFTEWCSEGCQCIVVVRGTGQLHLGFL